MELLHVSNCLFCSMELLLSLTVSYGFWLSLTVFTSANELLHISQCLPLLLGVSNCLFQFHGVAA